MSKEHAENNGSIIKAVITRDKHMNVVCAYTLDKGEYLVTLN